MDISPSRGSNTIGNMEVMGSGNASVIQYTCTARNYYRSANQSLVDIIILSVL